nr:CpXC domain-containing protein [Anaerolineae bacterium]
MPIQQTITCPSCNQPFSAILEQVLDVGVDPTVKERLLSGRVNLIICPQCGYRGMIGTPLMYHDPEKQLAITFVPMELNLEQGDRERIIGDMVETVMRALPEDAPRGYLLQPSMALTFQGLIDQVLEADGITKDMVEEQRQMMGLLEQVVSASSKEEAEALINENPEMVDVLFLEMLAAAAQSIGQDGDQRRALRLLNLRTKLLDTTEAGQEVKAQQEALAEASEDLQALGEGITRKQFVDLIVRAAGDDIKIAAYASLGRGLLDYSTFQLLTERIDSVRTEEERERLSGARDILLSVAAEFEKRSRAIVERAVDTLKMLIQSPDLTQAIVNNVERIDDVFLSVLQANLEEARKAGNVEVSSRLKQIRDTVMQILEAAAPPELRLMNALLSAESDSAALDLLHSRSDELSPDLAEVMGELVEQLRDAGNTSAAERLHMLWEETLRIVS